MIVVSVYVATYNHKDYIRQALDSIVCQKTNFKFEVIVHDDASTDGTAEIVKEFYEKYPELIIPILQKTNQYQLNVNKLTKFILPIAKGKYIAWNEGDDFWTDEYKLQKQVDYIENNDDCTMVVHHSNEVTRDGNFYQKVYTPMTNGNYSLADVLSPDQYFMTNSMLLRTNILRDNLDILKVRPCFDYLIKALAALNGQVCTLEDNMSCYRVMAKGSWSERIASFPEKRYQHHLVGIKSYEYLYHHSKYKHYHELQECIEQKKFKANLIIRNFKVLLHDPVFKKIYCKQNTRLKCVIFLGAYFPHFHKRLRTVKELFKSKLRR